MKRGQEITSSLLYTKAMYMEGLRWLRKFVLGISELLNVRVMQNTCKS